MPAAIISKQYNKTKMNVLEEVNTLKKEVANLKTDLKKMNAVNKNLKKRIAKNEELSQKKKALRKVSYIDWLNNERKLSHLIPGE